MKLGLAYIGIEYLPLIYGGLGAYGRKRHLRDEGDCETPGLV